MTDLKTTLLTYRFEGAILLDGEKPLKMGFITSLGPL
jgi:hypothetical protein